MSVANKRFCCSCSPRDATFTIGILLTVFSSFSFLASLRTLVRLFCVRTIQEYFEEIHVNGGDMIPLSIRVFQAIVVILLILSLIQVVANASLIVGVMKERVNLVRIWLMVYKLLVVLVCVAFLVLAILCFIKMYNTLVGVCFIIAGTLHACIAMYLISVVGCYQAALAASFTEFTNEYILELPRDGEKPYQATSQFPS